MTVTSRPRFARAVLQLAIAVQSILLALPAYSQTVPIFYTGYIEDREGVPVDGTLPFTLELYDRPTGGESLCRSGDSDAPIRIVAGYFRHRLTNECRDELRYERAVWVDLTIDGERFARYQIGAVPYALTADHATTAERADDFDITGTLSVSGDIVLASGGLLGPEIQLGYRYSVPPVLVAPGETGSAYARCDDGWLLLGGGCTDAPTDAGGELRVSAPHLLGPPSWRCELDNTAGTVEHELTATAICVLGVGISVVE
jgi:hypothetical protein